MGRKLTLNGFLTGPTFTSTMFKKFIFFGGLTGLLIPGLILLYVSATNETAGVYAFLLWPSSITLMANEQYSEGDPMIWINLALAVIVNVVWYTVLAGIAYAIFRKIGGRRSA